MEKPVCRECSGHVVFHGLCRDHYTSCKKCGLPVLIVETIPELDTEGLCEFHFSGGPIIIGPCGGDGEPPRRVPLSTLSSYDEIQEKQPSTFCVWYNHDKYQW